MHLYWVYPRNLFPAASSLNYPSCCTFDSSESFTSDSMLVTTFLCSWNGLLGLAKLACPHCYSLNGNCLVDASSPACQLRVCICLMQSPPALRCTWHKLTALPIGSVWWLLYHSDTMKVRSVSGPHATLTQGKIMYNPPPPCESAQDPPSPPPKLPQSPLATVQDFTLEWGQTGVHGTQDTWSVLRGFAFLRWPNQGRRPTQAPPPYSHSGIRTVTCSNWTETLMFSYFCSSARISCGEKWILTRRVVTTF